MTAAVIGERTGANKGVGFILANGRERADAAAVIGKEFLLSLTGRAFFALLDHGRRRMEDRHR